MLGADPLRLAARRLLGHHLVQPLVARRHELDLAAGAPIDEHVAHGMPRTRERFVDDRLERQGLAAAHLLVGGDDEHRAGVGDAVAQALRREAAEHHRVRRADARAGLHRDHALDRHRHVDDDAVALDQAARLQRVGEPAGALEQLAVGDVGDLAVVGLEDDRGLVAEAGLDVAVEAVVRRVERAVVEPLEERRLVGIEHRLERRAPAEQLARQPRPIRFAVGLGFGAQRAVGVHPGHPGVLHGALRRFVDVGGCAHGMVPRSWSLLCTSCPATTISAPRIPSLMTTRIRHADLVDSIAAALQYISYYHPADYIAHLARAYELEQSPAARTRSPRSSPTRRCAPRAAGRSARTPASSTCS